MDTDTAERLWNRVRRTEDHWLWTGSLNTGGRPIFDVQQRPRKRVAASKAVWMVVRGIQPDGILLRQCEAYLCVNPDHHVVGDQRDLARWSPPQRSAAFWAKVDRKGEGCWEWGGGTSDSGYGYGHLHNRPMSAHVVAWTLTNGPVPKGLFVCHSCDNPPCVRPDHLFLGTPSDNSADMVAKGRARSPRGTARGKLTAEQVTSLRRRYAEGGVSTHQLAADVGVSAMVIWRVVNRKSYLDVL